MSGEWVLTRDVLRTECAWLDNDMHKGDIVYPYSGVTYGCIGPRGKAFTEWPDMTPFFELPRNAVIENKDQNK